MSLRAVRIGDRGLSRSLSLSRCRKFDKREPFNSLVLQIYCIRVILARVQHVFLNMTTCLMNRNNRNLHRNSHAVNANTYWKAGKTNVVHLAKGFKHSTQHVMVDLGRQVLLSNGSVAR